MELITIACIALLLFGGKRLTHLGRDIGGAVRELRLGLTDAFDDIDEIKKRDAIQQEKQENAKT
jgi:TatA/E family protein of Tat protein translocase